MPVLSSASQDRSVDEIDSCWQRGHHYDVDLVPAGSEAASSTPSVGTESVPWRLEK